MRKTGIAILLFLYLAFTAGVAVNLHYCMGRFDSVQIGTTSAEYCGKCGMHVDLSNGCCQDEVKIFKISDDQQPVGLIKAPNVFFTWEPIHPEFPELAAIQAQVNKVDIRPHSPPLPPVELYISNRVFRI